MRSHQPCGIVPCRRLWDPRVRVVKPAMMHLHIFCWLSMMLWDNAALNAQQMGEINVHWCLCHCKYTMLQYMLASSNVLMQLLKLLREEEEPMILGRTCHVLYTNANISCIVAFHHRCVFVLRGIQASGMRPHCPRLASLQR